MNAGANLRPPGAAGCEVSVKEQKNNYVLARFAGFTRGVCCEPRSSTISKVTSSSKRSYLIFECPQKRRERSEVIKELAAATEATWTDRIVLWRTDQ